MKNDLDKFKNELLLALDNVFTSEKELNKFSVVFDEISIRYNIIKKKHRHNYL